MAKPSSDISSTVNLTQTGTPKNKKKGDNAPGNLTYMVFPFYFDKSLVGNNIDLSTDARMRLIDGLICNENTIWARTPNTISDNVLYDYIKPNTDEVSSQFLAYSLRPFSKDEQGTDPYARSIVWEKLTAEMPVKNEEKTFKLDFGHEKNNWNRPTLLISTSLGVGMLVMGINPKMKDADVEDVIDFNYHLHKIDDQQKLLIPLETEKLNEKAAEYKKMMIRQTRDVLFPDGADSHPVESGLEFQFIDIVRMLLRGIPEWTLFEKSRAHVFTYYSFTTDSMTLTDEEKQSIILLTRCANNKYNIPTTDFDNSNGYSSTFDNIIIGSSIEGGAICTLRQVNEEGADCNAANGFINKFPTGNLQHIYLWLYFMALMQRYVMLRMVVELSELDMNSDTAVHREMFNKRYGYFCNTKIKSFFRNVSSFTQHNRFYNFLIDNMEVDALYDEVENKMQVVDLYLQMQRNELMKERNEQNESQNKKYNQRSMWLNIVMALVALLQAVEIILEFKGII